MPKNYSESKNYLIFCSNAEHLVGSLRKKINTFQFIFPEKNKDGRRFFLDGEVYIRISGLEKIKKGRVVVVQSGMPEPNSSLIELEMVLQILKDKGINPELFFTYFPYGRQDKVFEPGETSVAESLIKKFVSYYKVRRIYIVDPHFDKRPWVKKYPLLSISATPLLVKKAKEDWGKDVLCLSPDKGGQRRTGIKGLLKERINSFKVRHFASKILVKGRRTAVVDDLISTGGTLLKCHDTLKSRGAKQTIALVSHGVLPDGIRKIKKRFKKLYLTNTINQKAANVDITGLIHNALQSAKN